MHTKSEQAVFEELKTIDAQIGWSDF